MTRTPSEVGALVRARRESLGLTQEEVPNVSSSLVRTVERGTASGSGRGLTRAALMSALRWPPNGLELLAAGADPADLDLDRDPDPEPIQMAASGADLEQLRTEDPEAYAALEQMARIALDRARRRDQD